MKAIKTTTLLATALMVLGMAGTAPRAQAQDGITGTGIELNAIVYSKCVKKPKTVPGTGGPAQLPPGKRWC